MSTDYVITSFPTIQPLQQCSRRMFHVLSQFSRIGKQQLKDQNDAVLPAYRMMHITMAIPTHLQYSILFAPPIRSMARQQMPISSLEELIQFWMSYDWEFFLISLHYLLRYPEGSEIEKNNMRHFLTTPFLLPFTSYADSGQSVTQSYLWSTSPASGLSTRSAPLIFRLNRE